MAKLQKRANVTAKIDVELETKTTDAFNVVARIPSAASIAGTKPAAPGAVYIGAHYDHLGMGGHSSLAPDKHEPHHGADDNASGTAVLLEVAKKLAAGPKPDRDIVFKQAMDPHGLLNPGKLDFATDIERNLPTTGWSFRKAG